MWEAFPFNSENFFDQREIEPFPQYDPCKKRPDESVRALRVNLADGSENRAFYSCIPTVRRTSST